MADLPYLNWYAEKWLSDPKVRTLTAEERGFYVDLLCLMWIQTPGYKTGRNLADFARNFGISRPKVERLLLKIHSKLGKSLPISDDYIESPFLKKQVIKAQELKEKRSQAGRLGGRPKKANGLTGEKPKTEHNVTEHNIKKNKEEKSDLFEVDNDNHSLKTEDVIGEYHTILTDLPSVRKITPDLRKKLKARIREDKARQELTWWADYFKRVRDSAFLSGKKTDWKASFPWLLGPQNMTKVLNGQYDNSNKSGKGNPYEGI